MGRHNCTQIYSLTVIELVYFARNISVSASSIPNCDRYTLSSPEHDKLNLCRNWTYFNRVNDSPTKDEFSSVPFVEFSIEYYGYSPWFFPDSWRIIKTTHANICVNSYVQRHDRMTIIIRTRLSKPSGLEIIFLVYIQKKSQKVVFLHVTTNIVQNLCRINIKQPCAQLTVNTP